MTSIEMCVPLIPLFHGELLYSGLAAVFIMRRWWLSSSEEAEEERLSGEVKKPRFNGPQGPPRVAIFPDSTPDR